MRLEAIVGRAGKRVVALAAVVVLGAAVVVPVAVSAFGDGDRTEDGSEVVRESQVVGRTDDGWQTIGYDGVEVDLPSDWVRMDTSGCEFSFERWGPPDLEPCAPSGGVAFYVSATFDPAHRSGSIRSESTEGLPSFSGYVYGGDYAAYVSTDDRDRAWRVLASFRADGETPSYLVDGPTIVGAWGELVEVPASWVKTSAATWCEGPGPDDASRCSPRGEVLRFHSPGQPDEVTGSVLQDEAGTWVGSARLSRDVWVSVEAPTQAIGDLVLASARDLQDFGQRVIRHG